MICPQPEVELLNSSCLYKNLVKPTFETKRRWAFSLSEIPFNTKTPKVKIMIHVRFRGKSYDLEMRSLNLRREDNDERIKAALARYFDLPVGELDLYVIDRRPGGELTVRPEAVYG